MCQCSGLPGLRSVSGQPGCSLNGESAESRCLERWKILERWVASKTNVCSEVGEIPLGEFVGKLSAYCGKVICVL